MTSRLFLAIIVATSFIMCSALFSSGTDGTGTQTSRDECVILLHGLCRSKLSMKIIENDLKKKGYFVKNIDYASTRKSITTIADEEVATAVSDSISRGHTRIHFVTHSLGAIVVRSFLQQHQLPAGSRIVMLAPPNQGSELVDWAQHSFPRLFKLAGPAAGELATQRNTLISQLKPITPATGIIIGNDSWNPFYSKILPGKDDGKVTIERAKLDGMRDFLIAPCNHSTILIDGSIRRQMIQFLKKGRFDHEVKQKVHQNEQNRIDNVFISQPNIFRGTNQAFLGIGR